MIIHERQRFSSKFVQAAILTIWANCGNLSAAWIKKPGCRTTSGPMDRNLYCPVKFSRLVMVLLLAAVFLCCSGVPPQQHSGSGDFHDITAFRDARMQLPERHESLCPVAVAPSDDECPVTVSELDDLRVFQDRMPLQEYRLVQSQQFDLDGDGIPEEYNLRDGKITVWAGSRIIWQSPDDWWVDYFFLGDADNDGSPELNLLLWKEGSFGPHKPFWVEEDDSSVKKSPLYFQVGAGQFQTGVAVL